NDAVGCRIENGAHHLDLAIGIFLCTLGNDRLLRRRLMRLFLLLAPKRQKQRRMTFPAHGLEVRFNRNFLAAKCPYDDPTTLASLIVAVDEQTVEATFTADLVETGIAGQFQEFLIGKVELIASVNQKRNRQVRNKVWLDAGPSAGRKGRGEIIHVPRGDAWPLRRVNIRSLSLGCGLLLIG